MIDDGLATGATMRAAVSAVKTKNPAKIVIAVPLVHWILAGLLKERWTRLYVSLLRNLSMVWELGMKTLVKLPMKRFVNY